MKKMNFKFTGLQVTPQMAAVANAPDHQRPEGDLYLRTPLDYILQSSDIGPTRLDRSITRLDKYCHTVCGVEIKSYKTTEVN